MNNFKKSFHQLNTLAVTVLFIINIQASAQSWPSVSNIPNYKNWKWDNVYVAKNKYISVAVVPDAGGRVLEYNLGDVPSLWVNPKMLGKSFAPKDEVKRDEWRNFGGYRLVPLPIENCAIDKNGNKVNRWPPPVIIGDSPYSAEITTNSEGTKSIQVTSGIQNLPVPTFDIQSQTFIHPEKIEERLQYKRSISIEDGSSLVHINHTIINKGDETIKRGIMISSQHVSESKPGLQDGQNFRAYIPFRPKYKLPNGKQYEIMGTADSRWQYVSKNRMPLDKDNPEHVKHFYNHGTNWMGETAPGIYEIHYDYNLMSGFHIISSEAWVCYVNKTNNTAFAKILEPYNPELEYDHGLNLAIFCSGLETGYLETEVKTPLKILKPGESFDYKEIHGAAKVLSTPILNVNTTGIITKYLSFDSKSNLINGEYGVFKEGTAILKFIDASGEILETAVLDEVNPLKAFSVEYAIGKDEKLKVIQLLLKGINKKEYLLDELTF